MNINQQELSDLEKDGMKLHLISLSIHLVIFNQFYKVLIKILFKDYIF